MDLYKFHSNAEDLHGHADNEDLVPEKAWAKYKDVPEELIKRQHLFAKNPHLAFKFVWAVLKKPWPMGEKAIGTNADLALSYAEHYLHKAFPLGEKAIATKAACAFHYATEITHKPFPLGEKAISTDPYLTHPYLEKFPERKDAFKEFKKFKKD